MVCMCQCVCANGVMDKLMRVSILMRVEDEKQKKINDHWPKYTNVSDYQNDSRRNASAFYVAMTFKVAGAPNLYAMKSVVIIVVIVEVIINLCAGYHNHTIINQPHN